MVGLGYRYLGLWKNRFFGSWAIFGCSQPLGRLIFRSSDTYVVGQQIFKKCGMKRNFWKFFRKTSKLSRNIFWACWDNIVAQKSLLDPCTPPAYRTAWYITQVAKRGGSLCSQHFRTFFFLKNRFLSDYVVPGSQHAKNIFLESLEVFQKSFFIPHFLKIFCPPA